MGECKEKWRNIRSCLLRSFKPSGAGRRRKRPYYLRESLEFVMPFVKSQDRNIIDPLLVSADDVGASSENETERTSEVATNKPQNSSNSTFKNRYRRKRPLDKNYVEYLRLKRHCLNETAKSPMHYFMLSLMPEFDTMTEDQIRHFKIEVMLLIDKIKNQDEVQASSSSYKQEVEYS